MLVLTTATAPARNKRPRPKPSPQELALSDAKSLPLTMGDLIDAMIQNGSRFEGRPSVKSPSLKGHTLRFMLACTHSHPPAWRSTLLMDNVRIAGIDHQLNYPKPDGTRGSGWHRHKWCPVAGNADEHLEAPELSFSGVEDFIRECLAWYRISLKEGGSASANLFVH